MEPIWGQSERVVGPNVPALAPLSRLLLAAIAVVVAACAGAERIAFVVGNGAYQDAPLANARNDAEDMAALLEGLGFSVSLAVDVNFNTFVARLTAFHRRTPGAQAALFYYAGHGVQVDSNNYLLPVDTTLDHETELAQTMELDLVLRGMRGSANLVFLDACRNNPFAPRLAGSMGTRSVAVGRGLAPVERAQTHGTFIAFATAEGEVAEDGEGRNSPFTAALKRHLPTYGVTIDSVMNRVRAELATRDQEPWARTSLKADFYFLPPEEGPSRPEPVLRPNVNAPFTVETEPRDAVVQLVGYPVPYRAGMRLPAGEYRVEASAVGYETRRTTLRHGSLPSTHRVVLRKATRKVEVGERFRDRTSGGEGPLMVVVPAGSFMMGSQLPENGRGDNEGPVHRVRFQAPFAVGVYEVTFAEWDACEEAGGCGGYVPEDEGWGRGTRPVVYVGWNDARSYAAWLSRETGQTYRLLSESEWEYAARGGTLTSRYWGEDESSQCRHANGFDASAKDRYSRFTAASCRDGHVHTAPVGSFAANGWGLHDMLGNVWELTEDCYNDSYAGAPSDGDAWKYGDCERRVLRGGSWNIHSSYLRAADRNWSGIGDRNHSSGFRVARTLIP